MGFVNHQQTVCRQVIKQRRRRFARPAPGKIARVVFDARAVAQLVHHFEVELGTLAQALLFQQLVVFQQHFTPLRQLDFYLFHRLNDSLAWRHVVRFRVDGIAWNRRFHLTGERIEQRQPLNLFIEQLDTQRNIVGFRREDVDHFTAHAEGAALEGLIVTGILQLRQAAQNRPLVDQHAGGQVQHHLQVEIRVAQTVDSRYRSHHHHIAPLKQRFGRRQTHLLDMLVHRRILLDEGV